MSATAIRQSAPNRTEAHRPERILAELRGELIARGMALQADERRLGMQDPSVVQQRREFKALLLGYESYAGEFGEEGQI